MKMKNLILGLLSLTSLNGYAFESEVADSVYLFSYSTGRNGGRDGLHLAWSGDHKQWNDLGPEHSWVRSDYGRWGSQKRMNDPYLFRGPNGKWNLLFNLNEEDGAIAFAASADLMNWKPQVYTFVTPGKNVLNLSAYYDTAQQVYVVSWITTTGGVEKCFSSTTKDFITFSTPQPQSSALKNSLSTSIVINGVEYSGQVQKAAWSEVEGLITYMRSMRFRNQLHSETCASMAPHFADLKPLEATLKANLSDAKRISDVQLGIFFEDINYAADGGLYAEMVQNRDFEYQPSDREGDKNWNSMHSWSIEGEGASLAIENLDPIHINNPNYAVLNVDKSGVSLVNSGWSGMVVKKGERYNLTLFARQLEGRGGMLKARLVSKDKKVLAETNVKTPGSSWTKLSAGFTAMADATDAQLEIVAMTTGRVALDMISLFPEKTFKGRKNGLRPDLAQVIADIHPKFVRFPGGCVAHGDGIDNIYNWKNSVGPLEARKPMRNLWGYHQTLGLGYYEYFQWCEDMGAHPLPVMAAGVPCQNSAHNHKYGQGGQMGGIPMCDMEQYVQDILDLVEWANGDPKSSKWAKMRAEAGHPKPFGLKYIGVGNEDLISPVFEERFKMIAKAVQAKYPEIQIIGTAGPFWFGSDYEEGWRIGKETKIAMLDEHYYNSPGWFVNNQDFYDKYDRSNPKVYLGEYAAHMAGRVSNIETALSEAIYLLSCERNGDVVEMTSYAPLLAKEKFTQWTPDLIYFNNEEVKPTVNYFVQKLFGTNSGGEYLHNSFAVNNSRDEVRKRVASSIVRDAKSGDVIVKMVNLLPVATTTKVELKGMENMSTTAERTILSGTPDDKTAKPISDVLTVGDLFDCELPAYSLTVIRIQPKTITKKR